MNSAFPPVATILFVLLVAWVSTLTFFVLRMTHHYNRLMGGGSNGTLKEVLDGLVTNQKQSKLHREALEAAVKKVHADGKLHIQKIGLVRFNPFADTGGSQSFTLALLNGNNTGLVMTSLYARTGHRWYIKEIVQGKGKEYELSREEQEAIRRASA